MKHKQVKPAAGQAQSPARGKRRTPDSGAGALAWRAADYEKQIGFGHFALTFSLGAGMMAMPLAALFVLANTGHLVVSLFNGEVPYWLVPDQDMLVLLAVVTALMGSAFSWTSIWSREIVAYRIDLEAQVITLHLAHFPKRVDLVVIPLSAIASLTPSMPGSFADAGYFDVTYAIDGLAPQQWQTRIDISKDTMAAHADALRRALGERLRPLVVDDR